MKYRVSQNRFDWIPAWALWRIGREDFGLRTDVMLLFTWVAKKAGYGIAIVRISRDEGGRGE